MFIAQFGQPPPPNPVAVEFVKMSVGPFIKLNTLVFALLQGGGGPKGSWNSGTNSIRIVENRIYWINLKQNTLIPTWDKSENTMADMQNWKPAKFSRHKPGNPLMLRCNNIESTGCTTIHIHQGPIQIYLLCVFRRRPWRCPSWKKPAHCCHCAL